MELRNRKKKGNRVVMFQLDPEPGSAVEIESPCSPKKQKDKVLKFEKLYYGQSVKPKFNKKL